MGKQKKVTLDARRAWFGQTGYFLIPTMALVIYSLAAASNVEFLAFMDRGVNPLVDALQYIGLGVVKPFVTGPMPERYYVNLVGIGMWGILAYNVRTILWIVSYHRHSSFVAVAAEEAAAKNGWTARRTWIVQRLLLLFLIVPATAYAWLCLLNSISGWIVFHVDDLLYSATRSWNFLSSRDVCCRLIADDNGIPGSRSWTSTTDVRLR